MFIALSILIYTAILSLTLLIFARHEADLQWSKVSLVAFFTGLIVILLRWGGLSSTLPTALCLGLTAIVTLAFLTYACYEWLYVPFPRAFFAALTALSLGIGLNFAVGVALGIKPSKPVRLAFGEELSDIDYNILYLAPKLWEELEVGKGAELRFSEGYSKLQSKIGTISDKYGKSGNLMEHANDMTGQTGREAKDILSAEQMNELRNIFSREKFVDVSTERSGKTFFVVYSQYGAGSAGNLYTDDDEREDIEINLVVASMEDAVDALKFTGKATNNAVKWLAKTPPTKEIPVSDIIKKRLLEQFRKAKRLDFDIWLKAMSHWASDEAYLECCDYAWEREKNLDALCVINKMLPDYAAHLLLVKYFTGYPVRKEFIAIEKRNEKEAQVLFNMLAKTASLESSLLKGMNLSSDPAGSVVERKPMLPTPYEWKVDPVLIPAKSVPMIRSNLAIKEFSSTAKDNWGRKTQIASILVGNTPKIRNDYRSLFPYLEQGFDAPNPVDRKTFTDAYFLWNLKVEEDVLEKIARMPMPFSGGWTQAMAELLSRNPETARKIFIDRLQDDDFRRQTMAIWSNPALQQYCHC